MGRKKQAREVLQRVMDPAEVEACCGEIEASVLAAPNPNPNPHPHPNPYPNPHPHPNPNQAA